MNKVSVNKVLMIDKNKYLKVELDIYERNYITINDIDYITYSEKYVNGYIGKPPPLNYNGEEIIFTSYPCMYSKITGKKVTISSYQDICVLYIRRLLVIFDRIQGSLRLQTPTRFGKEDLIKIFYKLLEDVSYLKKFLQDNNKFRDTVMEKIKEFEQDIQQKRIKEKTPLKRLKCLKERVKNITFT